MPTVIKIDVEGHEMAVLHGAKHLLKKYKPILIVESQEGTDFLFSLGYTEVRLLGSVRATNFLYS